MPSSVERTEDRPQTRPIPPKRGIVKIIVFFLIVVLAIAGLDRLVNVGLRRIETSSFGVTNRIVDGRVNADILISGSSRALTHYDPRLISEATGYSAFNIGINGSQTDMQVAMLKTYLEHNQKPKLIIHNLDLYAFQTTREIYDPAQYLPYLREGHIYSAVQRVTPDVWKWKWLPLYGYSTQDLRFTWLQGLRGLVGINPVESHIQGFMPRELSWTGDFEKLRATHPDGVRFEIEPRGIEDLKEIPQICRREGISLLLVYSPEYIEMQAMEKNRPEIFAKFREISAQYDVPLWDLSDSEISKSRINFYNSQHLNATGAQAFSRVLARRLREAGLLQSSEERRGLRGF